MYSLAFGIKPRHFFALSPIPFPCERIQKPYMPRLHEQRLVFMLAVNIHQQVCYLLQRSKVNERTIYAAYVFARSRQLTGYYQTVVLQLILPQHGLYGFLAFYIELRLYRRLFRPRGYELPACPLSQRQIYSVNNDGFTARYSKKSI